MSTIKAVIMDKDGSTIVSPNILPDELGELIQQNQHIHWVMATGRSLCNVLKSPMVELLNPEVPQIIEGGARVVNLNGECLQVSHLQTHEIEHFLKVVDLDALHYLFYSVDEGGGFMYSNNLEYWQKQIMVLRTTDDLSEFIAWFDEIKPAKLSVRVKRNIDLPGVNWTQNDSYIDVTTAGVHKGSAVLDVLAMLGVSPSETAFVFNDFNDLSVLEHPELSQIVKLKVGDLLPDVAADYELESPYDVARVLKGLLSCNAR